MTEPTSLGCFTIQAAHACLPGHFPGNPLVPGAVLLDEALAIVLSRHAGMSLTRIAACKFLAPVRPDEAVSVFVSPVQDGDLTLVCMVAGKAVLRGTVSVSTD